MPTGSLGTMFLPSRSQNFLDGIDVQPFLDGVCDRTAEHHVYLWGTSTSSRSRACFGLV